MSIIMTSIKTVMPFHREVTTTLGSKVLFREMFANPDKDWIFECMLPKYLKTRHPELTNDEIKVTWERNV